MGANDKAVVEVMQVLQGHSFTDNGTCSSCMKKKQGYFGPVGHEYFYCIECWLKYVKALPSQEKKEWMSGLPDRQVPCETKRLSELKTLMLAAAATNATVWLGPGSTNGYERWQLHTMCEKEPELTKMQHRSFGPVAPRARTFRFAPQGSTFERKEAVAMLQGETPEEIEESLDVVLARAEEAIKERDDTSDGLKALEEILLRAANKVTRAIAKIEAKEEPGSATDSGETAECPAASAPTNAAPANAKAASATTAAGSQQPAGPAGSSSSKKAETTDKTKADAKPATLLAGSSSAKAESADKGKADAKPATVIAGVGAEEESFPALGAAVAKKKSKGGKK